MEVADFGISGLDLAYALLDGYDAVILVDAIARGEPPGTLYLIEPQVEEPLEDDSPDGLIEAHSLNPATVLRLVRRLGGRIERLWLVGCEPSPESLASEEAALGVLAAPVAAGIDEAVAMILDLIRRNSAREEAVTQS